MMLILLLMACLFFLMGHSLRLLLGLFFCPGQKQLLHTNGLVSDRSKNEEEREQTLCTSFFDPFCVTVGPRTCDALEAIFDILIDRYVLCWYKTLSTDPDFVIQVKLYLQYLCASLIHRLKSFETWDTLDSVTHAFFGHFERILSSLPADTGAESVLEDSVLRSLGSHLHICMASRSAELTYMRALVNRILPYISYPPGLVPHCDSEVRKFLHSESPKSGFRGPKHNGNCNFTGANSMRLTQVPRPSSGQNPSLKQRQHVPLGTNPAAYSFLVEILSTCVLLPAMDALANPDLLNRFILYCCDPIEDTPCVTAESLSEVTVLNSYVQEWKQWINAKPPATQHMEGLLHNQEKFRPFMQYMKSVKSTVPLTALFLINNINRRVLRDPLPPDICREIRSQLVHLLSLIRDSLNRRFTDPEFTIDDDSTESPQNHSHPNPRLFDLPFEFEQLLTNFLVNPTEADALHRLVRTQMWRDAHRVAIRHMTRTYLSMYLESPEYMTHVFGTALHCSSDRPRTPSSPRHQPQLGSNLLENPLKSVFAGNMVEGRALYHVGSDGQRPPGWLTNRPTKVASQGSIVRSETAIGLPQHFLDGHHLLHSQLTSRRIDLSDWRVYIPGLSRPEIHSGKRLIDQLTHGRNPSGESLNRRPQYSSRPHDATFRAKITDELQNLQSATNANSMPQLSPQFLFTVRTERVVRGLRQPIARVDRKYSEFYVLEQKLIEFHGNAITRSLPPRKFSPRTFEFLEGKRELFEEYLQYLIAQPFLRNSELLYGFLTSKIPFTSNLLLELNLGRFVKSVPLKLIKERGQYLDQFLMSFYVSCNPQPILMQPVEATTDEPVFTIFPSSGVGTLGGIDVLASPDHYALKKSSSSESHGNCGIASTPSRSVIKNPHQPYPSKSSSVAISRSHKRTWLDNRLRVKMFWNNAGFSLERRHDLHKQPCDFRGIQPSGIIELTLYTIKSFIPPVPKTLPAAVERSETENECTTTRTNGTLTSVTQGPEVSVGPQDISNTCWNEALLCAPSNVPVTEISIPLAPTISSTVLQPVQVSSSSSAPEETANNQQGAVVSIALKDIRNAFIGLWLIFSQNLVMRLRLFVLWILYVLRGYFKERIDTWFLNYLQRYFRQTLTDKTIADALDNLKATLFYPYTPTTELEKLERKSAARAALQRCLTRTGITSILDQQLLEERIDKLFLCFQHPKWNKQLSYVLLDQLVTLLFPELVRTSSER